MLFTGYPGNINPKWKKNEDVGFLTSAIKSNIICISYDISQCNVTATANSQWLAAVFFDLKIRGKNG